MRSVIGRTNETFPMIMQGQSCLHVLILMQTSLETGVLQVFLISEMVCCNRFEFMHFIYYSDFSRS